LNLELDVLLYQFLETPIVFQVLLEFWHLFERNVTRDVPAVFVTLMVVVRPVRALAQDADGALVHTLDLGNLLQDRFGRGFRVHIRDIYVKYIYYTTKKENKTTIGRILSHTPSNILGEARWAAA
jgi:hypothetical protein